MSCKFTCVLVFLLTTMSTKIFSSSYQGYEVDQKELLNVY